MAQATTPRAATNAASAQARVSSPGRFRHRIGRVLRLLCLSLLVSIAIEWLGMHLWWANDGVSHSEQMLRREAHFLQQQTAGNWLDSTPVDTIVAAVTSVTEALYHSKPVQAADAWFSAIARYAGSTDRWRRGLQLAMPYLVAAKNIGELYAIRLTVLVLTIPLLALLIGVGLVDGLVQRDLRRWGGGRESAYLYHYAKRSNTALVASGAFIYLTMPISVHPMIILLPFSLACAVSVRLMASRFKKYL